MSPPDAVPPVEAVPEPLDGTSATVDPPASSSSAPEPTDLQALLATLVQGQAALTKALADQAAAAASQHSANQALLERIAILESAQGATEGQELQDQRTDLELDREEYLDVQEYAHLIPPGFKVTPGAQETPKPHLFRVVWRSVQRQAPAREKTRFYRRVPCSLLRILLLGFSNCSFEHGVRATYCGGGS